jgi:CDP-diacylglycerol--glycerol-3-phosphate 3-phosphatidyltransferase
VEHRQRLTVLRLALVPVFVALLLADGGEEARWRVLACVVFAVAAVTDLVDGDIARRRGLITDFGKIADPIADKALIGAALVGLSSWESCGGRSPSRSWSARSASRCCGSG